MNFAAEPTFTKRASPNAPWVLLHSGGGLRAMAASAVLSLCLMKSSVLCASSDNTNQGKSLYEMFHRQFGVSGGAWALIAMSHGELRDLAAHWNIAQLAAKLIQIGCVRDGDFDARTLAIHRGLIPKLGELGLENCCFCPAVWWSCCFGDNYPISEAINEIAGEVALAGVSANPLAALADLVAPIVLGKNASAQLATFDDNSGTIISSNSRALFESSSGSQRFHPETWIDLATEAQTQQKQQNEIEGYYHLFLRIEGGPAKALALNPPGGNTIELGVVDLAKNQKLPLRNLIATCGSAFATDARGAAERGGSALKPIADALSHFPFSSKALFGDDTVRRIHIDDVHGKFSAINDGLSRVRDAGVDCNVSLSAVSMMGDDDLLSVCWCLDNGAESSPGTELFFAAKRGHIGSYIMQHNNKEGGWSIWTRASGRGPRVVAYLLGLNDKYSANVRDVRQRERELHALYGKWMVHLPLIVTAVTKVQREMGLFGAVATAPPAPPPPPPPPAAPAQQEAGADAFDL